MKVSECAISIGDGIVTVKRKGTRPLTVARVLGTVDADGIEVLCLDRLVHNHYESPMDGWHVAGAVTSLLFPRKLTKFVVLRGG
jgi:hypothetical protein